MTMTNPSRLYLAKLDEPPATVLEFLVTKFPRITREEWVDRFERGLVRTASGRALSVRSPYAHGLTVVYYRETEQEPHVPFEEKIVYRDERIVIVDKPHFLPVVPGGPYVDECVLARVRKTTGIESLTPMHRLDRDTAGLVLFVIAPELRAQYHRLFADEDVDKEYRAVARVPVEPQESEWSVENRLAPSEPWFRMQIVEGEPNSSTHVTLEQWRDGLGLFRLRPRTGKKHQLRVHMASLGYPILNDTLYPELLVTAADDYSRPLQLLAWRLAFTDPVSGAPIEVESERELIYPETARST